MSNNCTPRMTPSCEKKTVAIADSSAAYLDEDISVCLPFGGTLYTEGGIIKHEPSATPPADGVYGKVVVKNGCIIGVEPEDVAIHTSAPCAPIPSPCDCGSGGTGSGGGSLPSPSTTVGNLFGYDAAGRPLVRVFMQEGAGIDIAGAGTQTDPYVLSSTVDGGGTDVLATGALYTEEGNGHVTVLHRDGKAASVSGMEFDAYGHLIRYTAPDPNAGVSGVTAVLGDNYTTSAETNQLTGTAVVSLKVPNTVYKGKYILGGYEVELDGYNRIEHLKRVADFPAGEYVFGDYTVSIDEFGFITEATPKADTGAVMTCASKYFGSNQMDWTMNFVTDAPSSFRISIKVSSQPQSLAVIIDDVNYSTSMYRFGNNHMEILPAATFPAGSHQIYITDMAQGNPISPSAIVDVFLATVV